MNTIPIPAEVLAILRSRGGSWAVYQDMVFDSHDFGEYTLLQYGPDCTFQEPPRPALPDTPAKINWRYRYFGSVDLKAGVIVREES